MSKPCVRCEGTGLKRLPLRNGNAISICSNCEGLGEIPAATGFAERFGCLLVLGYVAFFWFVIAMLWRSFR